jgi:hypothetical protein
MNKEQRGYIYTAVFLNCVMAALAVIAFAVSLWLAVSGRLFSEGADATFLCAVGLVAGCVFASVPLLSIRDGLLRDVRELLESVPPQASARPERERARAWRESPAH